MSKELTENVANNVAQREMQDLTEQWKDGTLEEDFYYVKNKACLGVEIDYYHVLHSGIKYWSGCEDEDVEEVLAPVPSCDQFVELVTKCHRLEKQLDIAVKALREYADENSWVDCKTSDDDFEYIERKCAWYVDGYETAQQALKEIEVFDMVGTLVSLSKEEV